MCGPVPRSLDERLYGQYLDACLSGTPEDPETFRARHPDVEPALRARLDGLFRMLTDQQAKAADPAPAAAAQEGLPCERLGEFRLIRRLEEERHGAGV